MEFDPDKHVDEFVVLDKQGDASVRYATDTPAIQAAKKLADGAIVLRVRMSYTLISKRKHVDYHNPVEEVQVWP